MKRKTTNFNLAGLFITGAILFLSVFIISAQPTIATPDGYAAYQGTTGGGNATPIIVSTASAFKSAVSGTSSKVIVVNGRINLGGNVSIGSNTTLVGANTSSGLYNGAVLIQGSNYIIQNLTFGPTSGDVLEVSGATKVFITKCSFHDSSDELCSIVRQADFVTVSWSKFYFDNPDSHSFAHLIGNGDGVTADRGKLHVTLHHNWYDKGVRGRMPRVRFGHVHVYNCYYNTEDDGYCIGVGYECHIRVENSHFEDVNNPWADYGGTSNGEMGWNNLKFEGCSQPTFVSNSWPVFSPPYSFSLDGINDVESNVRAGAGNVIGNTTVSVTGVLVSPTNSSVSIGGNIQITATVIPSDATNKNVSWSSSNASVASVSSSGLVNGINYGTAIITATTQDGGFSAQCNVEVATIPVTGVAINPTSAALGIGGTTLLTAIISPSNATNKNVSWSTSNSSVASVNSSGLVTGNSLGSAAITVTTLDGSYTAISNITVSDVVNSTLTIQENETGVVSYDGSIDNENLGFTGDGYINTDNASGNGINYEICVPSNGSYTLAWRHANGGSTDRTAEVQVDGSVTASNISFSSTGSWTSWANISGTTVTLTAGTRIIRLEATNSLGLSNIDYMTITGNNPLAGECQQGDIPVTGVSILPTSVAVNDGATTQLTATVSPLNATNKNVSWSTNNSSVASVSSSGLVTGNSPGSATIIVTTQDGGYTATSQIIVNTVTVSVTGVTVAPNTATINLGSTTQLTPSVSPSNATNQSISWNSSNSSVASVSSSGLVTGIAAGTASITVTTQDGGFTAVSNIIVSIISDITIIIQENEIGFCSVDGSVDNNNAGFTGDGFANTDNASGNGITWSLNVPSAGIYSLVWRYANGGSTDRTAQFMEDGSTLVSSISMPSTGSWTNWTETSAINVNLSTGTNLIRLQATNSSGLANIDYLKITGISPTPVSCSGLKSANEANSIAKLEMVIDVNIYPVPVNNFLNIEFSEESSEMVNIMLFDATGRILKSTRTSRQTHTVNISELTSGIYMIRILGTNINLTKQIIKR